MINHCDNLTLIYFLHVSKIFQVIPHISQSYPNIWVSNWESDLLQYLNLIFFTSFFFLKWFAGGGHSLQIDIVVANISNSFMHLAKPQIS